MCVADEMLKPCPFCGGEAEIWRAGGRKTSWVACMGRCATLVSKEHTTDAEAIAAWNRRAGRAHPFKEGTVMRVTDEMVDAAIAADSHASWWAGNSREGAEKRMRAALEAALAVEGTEAVEILYTNWRGETATREIVPVKMWFGSTEWHSEPQWLITAHDMQKGATRDFALSGFGYTTPPAGIREALINLNAELDAMWNTPADQRVQDGKINSVLVQNITNAQIACVAALRGQS